MIYILAVLFPLVSIGCGIVVMVALVKFVSEIWHENNPTQGKAPERSSGV